MLLKFPLFFPAILLFLPIIPKIILDKNQPSTLNLLNLHIYIKTQHNISYLNM